MVSEKAVGVLSDGRIIAAFEGGQCSIFHTTDRFVISSREELPVLSVSASEVRIPHTSLPQRASCEGRQGTEGFYKSSFSSF